MHIVQLTEGTGSWYGGTGVRDHALIIALRRLGHRVNFVCLTSNIMLDEEESWSAPIFYDQSRVCLEQTSSLYRALPKSLAGIMETDWLFNRGVRKMNTATPQRRGEFIVSLLRGKEGKQVREFNRLMDWLRGQKPDLVSLSSLKHAAIIPAIQEELGVPVILHLAGQYQDFKLLPKQYRDEAFALASGFAKAADGLIAPSTYFADLMAEKLELDRDEIKVIPNGISLNYYSIRPAPPIKPAIGYLSRLARSNGLEELIAVFQDLKKKTFPSLELAIAGGVSDTELDNLAEILKPVTQQPEQWDVKLQPNIPFNEKLTFLQNLTLLCVPARDEPFGNYVLEAMAVGVPAVLPDSCAFPEIIETTGGGLLYDAGKPDAMREKIEELINDSARSDELSRAARQGVLEHYSSERMAGDVLEVFEKVLK